MRASPPTDADLVGALVAVARALDAPCSRQLDGRFYFVLGDTWALSISPDSAGRFRLGACYGQTEVATMWCRVGDRRHLADLALSIAHETAPV